MTTSQLLLTISVIAVVTFLTRSLAFVAFGGKKIPKYVKYLGYVLPTAIIGMLVVYCFKDTAVLQYPYGIPELIAGVAVVALHKWKHNLLLSMLVGTALYMVLVQLVFV
ncbi:MAG: branched-chain amino acid transporter AzlD [Bacillota bacterium]|nr:MAG: branched-chain amino acid transporter AzlD [Bacillota bacterium]